MNRRRSTAPLLEPEPSELERHDSATPAQTALQSNLDSNPTLKKKNSWFSIRGSIQKGASTIKGAIDSLRGEQSKIEDDGRFERLSDAETGDISTPSESERSITPMRPTVDRRATFSPNSAISSIRHPFPRHSTRQKRGSVHSVYYGDRPPPPGAVGPERFSTDSQNESTDLGHRRRTSVTSSIVGSIRSIGRAAHPKKATAPSEVVGSDKRSPTKVAATVPLPSSPIPIAAPAPALPLDFGPAGFMPPAFVDFSDADRQQDLRRLTDSDNITNGLPSTGGLHVPAELAAKHERSISRSNSPGNFLSIPLPEVNSALCNGPPTPMPGTNLCLELDGTGAIDLPVFEHSVENDSDASQKCDIRRMRSLDVLAKNAASCGDNGCAADSTEALAQAAAIAHRADEDEMHRFGIFQESSISGQSNNTFDALLSPEPLVINRGGRPGCRRDLASASTVSTCPSDMQSLCQQSGPLPADMDDCGKGTWSPEAQSNFGPPSPTRNVDIPLRLKTGTHQDEVEGEEAEFNFNTPRPLPAVPHNSRAASFQALQPTCRLVVPSPFPERSPSAASKEAEPPRAHGSAQGDDSPNLRTISNGFLSFDFVTRETRQLFVAADSASDSNSATHPTVANDAASVITDYDEYKTQQLFLNTADNDSIDLPNYDQADYDNIESSPVGSPVNVAPLVMSPLYQAATSSQATSPTSNQAGLRGTDVGNLFWRFNVDSWLGHGQQRGSEVSIDGFSEVTEKATASENVAVPVPNDIPSMGDLLQFELNRSQRNMRYNALQAGSSHRAPPPRPSSSDFTFGQPKTETDELQLAVFDAAFADAEAALDRNGSTATQGSVRRALNLAIQETNRAVLTLDTNILTDSSESGTPVSSPAIEIHLPERSSLDYLRSPVDQELLDAIPTSSPIQLTEWERSELQSAVPSQAHEQPQQHHDLDSGSTSQPATQEPAPTGSAFDIPIKAPVLPPRAYSPVRRVISAADAPKDLATAGDISTSPDSPTGGLRSGGFSPSAAARESSQNRFAALVEAPRKALRVLGESAVNTPAAVLVQPEGREDKEESDLQDQENAGAAVRDKRGGGFRPMRFRGSGQ